LVIALILSNFGQIGDFFLTKDRLPAIMQKSSLFLNILRMTTLQKIGYAGVASMFSVTQAFAALDFGRTRAESLAGGTAATGEAAIMNLIRSFLQFVTIIAVLYVLWAGFQMLTAGGDEEKVKTGRKIIIQVILGIVVMWLAYAVVNWVVGALV